jgi:alanine racemase
MPDALAASASVLEIDLGAVAANYRWLASRLGGGACAAAVKADGYGLGAARVAPALAAAGCTTFFVATPDEGAALRAVLPDAVIAVLNGVLAGTEEAFVDHGLVPVVNDLGQVARWREQSARLDAALPAMLHVDTGMNRLGLPPAELDWLAESPQLLAGPDWHCLLSHLACADEPDHPMNREQLARFRTARARLPRMPASLANSAGVLLGPEYHFDLARPGIALYGGNPLAAGDNPMRPTVRLLGRILQVREAAAGMTVGYGAGHRVTGPARIATVGAGYADGYLRAAGGRGHVSFEGVRLPIVGRVSMDLITVDVSALPPGRPIPGDTVTLIGDAVTLDEVARAAGTIPYEILTGLGRRYVRRYVEPDQDASATGTGG